MTVKITFPQRQKLDELLKAGDKGLTVNMASATIGVLVQKGYAEWRRNDISVIPRLVITAEGRRFYQNPGQR